MWEMVLVVVIVGLALFFSGWALVRNLNNKEGGCGGCKGCSPKDKCPSFTQGEGGQSMTNVK